MLYIISMKCTSLRCFFKSNLVIKSSLHLKQANVMSPCCFLMCTFRANFSVALNSQWSQWMKKLMCCALMCLFSRLFHLLWKPQSWQVSCTWKNDILKFQPECALLKTSPVCELHAHGTQDETFEWLCNRRNYTWTAYLPLSHSSLSSWTWVVWDPTLQQQKQTQSNSKILTQY